MPIQNMTTLAQLLSRLKDAPIPFAPVPADLGPLSTDTSSAFQALNPEPAPPRFIQPGPADQGFVSNYAGQEPTRPTIKPPSLLEKILVTAGGFGAGYQGNGPAYVESIRRQRQAPFERYERQREQFEDRRARGIELAERRAEREAEQANRMNELAYERDFKLWLSKNNDRSDEAKQRMAQMFTLQRDANAARLDEEKEQRRERRQQERDAIHISDQYFGLTKNKALSDEIGKYRAGLKESLSPAAAALERRVMQIGEARMTRGASVGGGGRAGNAALRAVQEVEAAKGELLNFMQRAGGIQDLRARTREERRIRSRIGRAVGRLNAFPGQAQGGVDAQGFPWGKVWNGQQFVGIGPDSSAPAPGQQPQGKTISMERIRALAAQANPPISEQEAIQRAVAQGYMITQ